MQKQITSKPNQNIVNHIVFNYSRYFFHIRQFSKNKILHRNFNEKIDHTIRNLT